MTPILQVFYCLFSALLLSVAIPNEVLLYGSPFIAFAALIPYYLCFKNCRNYYHAFFWGFIQACTTHLLSSFWLAFFKDFAALTLGASALGTGIIGAMFGMFMYMPYSDKSRKNVLNLASPKAVGKVSFRIIWFAATWTFYEWVKGTGFLGYPWGTLSSCMFRSRIFMQLSAITGTYGISFLTAFFAALMGEGLFLYEKLQFLPGKERLFSEFRRTCTIWLVFFSLSMIYGFVSYNLTRKPQKVITAVLVQQNEDPWLSPDDSKTIRTSQHLTDLQLEKLKAEGKKADIIVWSEGVLKTHFPYAEDRYGRIPYEMPLTRYIQENQTPLLAGGSVVESYGPEGEEKEYFNAAIMFDKDGKYRGYYGKNHLVPFAEAIPFMEYPKVRQFLAKVIGISAGWTPGRQYTYFDIPCSYYDRPLVSTVKNISLLTPYENQMKTEAEPPVTRISTPICFDDAFTDVCRPLWKNGSEVFMNITDDSWSLKKSSEIQHFVISVYRAIEYRTTLVRSTNAGVSMVADPSGKILKELPLFEEASMYAEIPVYERKTTVYAKFGNWLPFILGVLLFTYFVYNLLFYEEAVVVSEREIKTKKSRKKKEKDEKKKKSDKKESKKSDRKSKKTDKKKSSKK